MEFFLNKPVSSFMNLFLSIIFYIMRMYVHENKNLERGIESPGVEDRNLAILLMWVLGT